MRSVLNKISSGIKTEEWGAVILSFIYYFCILASYYIMRPIRDQFAVEVGSLQLPWFFAATFLATLLLTPLFAWLVSRWQRGQVIPVVYLFFIGCQLAFIPLFNNRSLLSSQHLGALFFVWVSVFNLFAVSIFWSFMSDIWNDLQARRVFPLIALGGTCGAVLGPLITSNFVEAIGLALLLLISAGLLIVAVVCVFFLGNWAYQYGVHRHEAGSESAVGGGMLDGLKQIFCNFFVGQMSLIMVLNDMIGTIAYVLITDYSGATFPRDAFAQTRFAANIDLFTNIIQIVVQVTITRWLLVRCGAGLVFGLCAGITVCACLALLIFSDPYALVFGQLPGVALVLILTRSLSHGMIQPARETLYTLVSRNVRYKGKNAVDTVIWRGGDVLSTLSINGFRALGVNVAGFGVIWILLAATSGMLAWRLANKVERGDFYQD